MRLIVLLLLLVPCAQAGKTFRSEKNCQVFELFDRESIRLHGKRSGNDQSESYFESFADRWPHIGAEIEARLNDYRDKNPITHEIGEAIRQGTLTPVEAFDRIAAQTEGELKRLENMVANLGKNESGDEQLRNLRSIIYNFYLKHTLNLRKDEFHEANPWYVNLHRAKFLELRREIEGFKPPLTEAQFRKVTQWARILPSILSEVNAALQLPNIRFAAVHAGELENMKLLKKELPKELRTSEIDLIGDEGGGMVIYEIKRYQSRKVGEEDDFNDTLSQMKRLKEVASLMRLRTRVKMVSYTGFSPEARRILEFEGIELIDLKQSSPPAAQKKSA